MFERLKKHLQENNGDENVSKMTLVAIVFIVGAILLLLVTTAFKGPIKEWYNNTVTGWFAEDNGAYSYDEWTMYEKNDNGTYKGLDYVLHLSNGKYVVLSGPETLHNTTDFTEVFATEYNADGSIETFPCYFVEEIKISNDGRTIRVDGQDYHAQLP